MCGVVTNSNSKMESGDVTNRLKWFAIAAAVSGKLHKFSL